MALNLSAPETTELKPRIVVFGVGGAGGNAVNNMIDAQLEGVDFVAANTDAQALHASRATARIQMGAGITEGLGAGARPEVGEQAAEDSLNEILEHLSGAHMVFITAGMGGGTGTGAAPVIARAAREQGVLTVGVVTKPFHFEGARRMRLAESGIEQLQEHVDTLIIIPNQNLFRIANEKTTFAEAFAMADQVLHSGVRGITDLMIMPGLINLDFADVRTVMSEMGKAMMGTGEAGGESRSVEAARAAIANPLLDDVSMKGAKGVLINITGGMDMTLYEVDEAANEIRNEVDPDANIIVGSTFNPDIEGVVRVSVVATGIDGEEGQIADPRRHSIAQANAIRERQPMVRRAADEPRPAPRVETRPEPRPETRPETRVEAAPRIAREDIAPRVDAARPDSFVSPQDIAPAPQPEPQKPAVARMQEELEQAAADIPVHREPAPQDADEAEPQRRGLSLFGRRARPRTEPTDPAVRKDPVGRNAQRQEPAKTEGSDLFGAEFDESELEIPAFLRRQAN